MIKKLNDVLIVGSGIVGMATLMTLEKHAIKASMLPQLKDIINKVVDPRFYAITPGVKKWLEDNGVYQHLSKESISPVNKITVYSNKEDRSIHFNAHDAGINELAFIINHHDLEKAFIDRVSQISYHEIKMDSIESIDAEIDNVGVFDRQGKRHKFKLVIGADGSNSRVRSQSVIAVKNKKFNQTAIVFNIECSKAHQGCAHQKFLHDGILALLPIHTHEFSIVFSLNDDILEEYKILDDDRFLKKIKKEMGEMFGDMKLLTKRQYFPLFMQINESLISDRIILIGDAAHQLHPLAGQGLNLGLRDVIELDELIGAHKKYHHDLGLKQFLKKYNRNRKTDILSLTYLTDYLSHLFSSHNPIVNFILNFGLSKIDQTYIIKKILLNKAIH